MRLNSPVFLSAVAFTASSLSNLLGGASTTIDWKTTIGEIRFGSRVPNSSFVFSGVNNGPKSRTLKSIAVGCGCVIVSSQALPRTILPSQEFSFRVAVSDANLATDREVPIAVDYGDSNDRLTVRVVVEKDALVSPRVITWDPSDPSTFNSSIEVQALGDNMLTKSLAEYDSNRLKVESRELVPMKRVQLQLTVLPWADEELSVITIPLANSSGIPVKVPVYVVKIKQ